MTFSAARKVASVQLMKSSSKIDGVPKSHCTAMQFPFNFVRLNHLHIEGSPPTTTYQLPVLLQRLNETFSREMAMNYNETEPIS